MILQGNPPALAGYFTSSKNKDFREFCQSWKFGINVEQFSEPFSLEPRNNNAVNCKRRGKIN